MVSDRSPIESSFNNTKYDRGGTVNPQIFDLIKADLPIGLFIVLPDNEGVLMNPWLTELLEIPINRPGRIPYRKFFDHLVVWSNDPEITRINLEKKISRIQENPSINISSRTNGEAYYVLTLFPASIASASFEFGGVLFDNSLNKSNLDLRLKVLGDQFQKSRKLSASAGGNLDALAANVHIWNDEIVDDFLFDTRDQLQTLNGHLDLVLNLINVLSSRSVFPESVNIKEFLEGTIDAYPQVDLHILDAAILDDPLFFLYLDPSLTRLALSYLIDQIISKSLSDQAIDLIVDQIDEMIRVRIQGGRTLPLPGLDGVKDDGMQIPFEPEVHLAESIISALGGEVRLGRNPIEQGAGIGVTILLPKVAGQIKSGSDEWKIAPSGGGVGRILLAESQVEYQLSIGEALRKLGYRVDLAVEGNTALDMVQRINPDAVVTARNLSGTDGLLLTQGIRRWSAVPVIMLSSRTGPDDLARAFEAGVDDYIKKPFLMDELIFRLKANLRRYLSNNQSIIPEIYNSGVIRIDYSTRQVWRRGVPVQLTPIEYNLLVYMTRQRKQIMTYEQLLERVWDGPEKGSRQGLFVHVSRLRDKIESDPDNPLIITNKWGVGYEFNPDAVDN
jgi:DNA-binding response OmpR family regulator